METSGTQKVEQFLNRQFYDLLHSDKRFRVHRGGTRSGKSWACCQYIAYLLQTTDKPLEIDIVRKTLPALKGSIMKDMIQILMETNMYWEGEHNKSENYFIYKGSTLSFISVDQPQKIRGRRRNIALLEEANELTVEDFRQINMRTTDYLIFTYNPSDPVHWLYEELDEDITDEWVTTYKDNQFLSIDIVKQIERMKEKDPDFWRVFGEGEKAVFSQRQIFNDWQFIDYKDFPETDVVYLGLDWGYSIDPAAICEVRRQGDSLYIHEICYRTGMTNKDIVDMIAQKGYRDMLIIYDAAEPKSGEECRRLDPYNSYKASVKGQGSINAGISLLREYDVFVSNESTNMKKEYESYWWDVLKDGTIINKPIDKNNHLMDALRGVVYTAYGRRQNFFVI